MSFAGRHVVVTGGARGIGRAIVYRLAGLGAYTFLWDLDGPAAERTANELRALLVGAGRPASIGPQQVNVSDEANVTASMAQVAISGGLDVLVNNAGTTSVGETVSMPSDVWEQTLHINATGCFYCCRAAIPYLKQRPGASIVNISSSAALVGGGGGAHYAASKAAVDGLTRHLAHELAPEIRVNSIQPRTIDTQLLQARYADDPAGLKAVVSKIPLGRTGRPEDIADAVAFLASDWASYITGQILLVDGGRTYQ